MKFTPTRTTLVVALVATACAMISGLGLYLSTDASAAGYASPESRAVAVINEHRSTAGVAPLRVDPTMMAAADAWTDHLVARSTLSHAHPEHIHESTPPGRSKSGENVGRGRTVDSLLEAFMRSPAHRANILDPAFTHIGVAVEVHPSSGQVYTTQRFASLAVNTPEPPATPTPAATSTPEPAPSVRSNPPLASSVIEAQLPPLAEPRGSRRGVSTALDDAAPGDGSPPSSVRGSRRGVD